MNGTTSVWTATTPLLETQPLFQNYEVDVCVIGAGIAGLSTAYLLARQGRSVLVLDDGPIGGGETGRTTAHLSNALDDRYYEIERLHGQRGAQIAAESHTAAISLIESIVLREQIDCDFERVNGYLFAPSDGSQQELDREYAAADRAGLTGLQFVSRAPMPLFDSGRCLLFPRQAQFNPLKYLNGLAQAVVRYGGQVATRTHAESIEGSSPLRVRVSGGHQVKAQSVVMATNSPIWDSFGLYTLQAAYRTYVIGARLAHGASINPVPKALFWDTSDPYHYVRLQGDVLIVGGEDHRTGQSDDMGELFARLEAWTRERFPIDTVDYRWSGQVLEPVDGMAFIGRYPWSVGNVFVATGDSGNGMTHGTIAGMILTDLIQGKENNWSGLYDPSRITANALGNYASENLNVAAQYGDWLAEPDVDSRDQIAPGAGATIQGRSSRIAVYRDEQGVYHEFSAVCPHLGGIVSWNDTEKSWDCPCHGSRFDCFGKVLDGPANRGLDSPDSLSPLLTAAGVGLQTAALMTANGMKKLITLGIKTGL